MVRFDSIHTHGTGCTLSSVIASALALGHQQRSMSGSKHAASGGEGTGATRAIHMIDACCLAKAYITEGVARGVQVGCLVIIIIIITIITIHYTYLDATVW